MDLFRSCGDWFSFGELRKRRSCLRPFLNTSWHKIDLVPYLERFGKANNKNNKNFKIRLTAGRFKDQLSPGPYRDASYTMALYETETTDIPREEEYLACIGFEIDEKHVLVKQIQGNPGKEQVLKLFKWERMLLAILTDWASRNGFKQIRVIRAKDQEWYKANTERAKRMFMHYDVTARRSGFFFDEIGGQYVKNIA